LDGNGCDTRAEVLAAESVMRISVGPGCKILAGAWFSIYDGLTVTNPTLVDIDHFVPLAEAWDSGAASWSPERRELYANDLDDPDSLIAVTESSNGSKSDDDPADWMPDDPNVSCTYVAMWVGVKVRWGLTADQREMDKLRQVFDTCGDI
jgi:hypothetical protein